MKKGILIIWLFWMIVSIFGLFACNSYAEETDPKVTVRIQALIEPLHERIRYFMMENYDAAGALAWIRQARTELKIERQGVEQRILILQQQRQQGTADSKPIFNVMNQGLYFSERNKIINERWDIDIKIGYLDLEEKGLIEFIQKMKEPSHATDNQTRF